MFLGVNFESRGWGLGGDDLIQAVYVFHILEFPVSLSAPGEFIPVLTPISTPYPSGSNAVPDTPGVSPRSTNTPHEVWPNELSALLHVVQLVPGPSRHE